MTEPSTTDIRKILRDHAGLAKAAFFLWVGSVFAAYLFFIVVWLPGLGFPTLAVLLAGLVTGIWYVIAALLGGLILALLLPAHKGVHSLGKWTEGVLEEAAEKVRNRGSRGSDEVTTSEEVATSEEPVIVDVGAMEEEVDTIIDFQTSQLGGETQGPGVVPNLAGRGLRFMVISAAGDFTKDTLEKGAVGVADQLAMGSIRRVLWTFSGMYVLAFSFWLGLPLLLAWGLAKALGLTG